MEIKLSWENWQNRANLDAKQFTCGNCGKEVGAHTGYFNANQAAKIYLCPNCGVPTFFFVDEQFPGPMIGRDIGGLSADIQQVYKEIRKTMQGSSFTATVLLGRKLIMHIAVEAGADEGKSFKEYINFLASKHYVPPKSEKLLEFMRELGNEKNHEIKLGTAEEAQKIVKFIEALLYFVYELESEFVPLESIEEPKQETV